MKVDFFVAGFSKCGTTTLYAMLGEHPDIFVPEAKEPNFFAQSYHYGWAWYAKFFAEARPGQRCGEGSTFYSSGEFAETACQRIVEHYPDARFIFIARNPIKRLESSYRELHHSGETYCVNAPFSIGEALRQFPSMIDDTLYWQRLSSYRKYVPDDRILPMLLEDFQRQPAVELALFRVPGRRSVGTIEHLDHRLNPRRGETVRLPADAVHPHAANGEPDLEQAVAAAESPTDRSPRPAKTVQGARAVGCRDASVADRALGDDARQFLAYCGKPADSWDLNLGCPKIARQD